jgi:uncharacterized damage-inducible protein DinB
MLGEYDHEMNTTRSLLARVPDAKGSWQPHQKSMTLGKLAIHIATLPGWVPSILSGTEFDTSPPGGSGYTTPPFKSTKELLTIFDRETARARAAIAAAPDTELMVPWSLKSAGKTVFTMPRVAVLRSFFMNHSIHHRGQLSVYLRLNDVPLPSIYGPTADTIDSAG